MLTLSTERKVERDELNDSLRRYALHSLVQAARNRETLEDNS